MVIKISVRARDGMIEIVDTGSGMVVFRQPLAEDNLGVAKNLKELDEWLNWLESLCVKHTTEIARRI